METPAEFKARLQAKHTQLTIQTGFRSGWIDVPQGWQPLVEKLADEISNILLNNPQISFHFEQIKEKFGALRIYSYRTGDTNKLISKVVMETEVKSVTVCQDCGEPGSERPLRWIRTLCNKHYAERLNDERRLSQSLERGV
jgi:hypothetical protein